MAGTVGYDQFNTSVKGRAMAVRREMVANARSEKVRHEKKDSKNGKTTKLAKSVSVWFKKEYGMIHRISFSFARHGEFVHYGVGRGYVRLGNAVVRGRKYGGDEIGVLLRRGYTRREIAGMRYHYRDGDGEIKRKPVDRFDGEIRSRMPLPADYAGNAFGDRAMNALLEKTDRPLPVFTKHVKTRQKKNSNGRWRKKQQNGA